MRNQGWWKSLKSAISGCIFSFKTQRNFRVHLVISLLVLIFSFWLEISADKFLFLLLAIFLGLTVEMANTAFEKTLDAVSEEYNPKIKIAKDVSAGMMLLISFGLGVIGLIIFLPAFLGKLGFQ